jgi:tripartite-type tricarboxylate transporter receptor subunit TctC
LPFVDFVLSAVFAADFNSDIGIVAIRQSKSRQAAAPSGLLLRQQIAVENKPGANGGIAAPRRQRRLHLAGACGGTLTTEISKSAPSVKMSKDFAPIAMLASGPFVL